MRGSGLSLVAVVVFALTTAAFGCRSTPESSRDRAKAAWVDQDYARAAAEYETYLASNPQGPEAEEAELALADIYFHNLKQYDRARDRYGLFLSHYPQSAHVAEARRGLAEVYVELKAFPDAVSQYETYLEENPDTPDRRKIRATIADLYFQAGDVNQSEVEYDRVVADAPYDELTEQALLRLASIAHLVRGQEERAIPAYDRVANSTDDPAVRRSALYSLSETYASLFRYDEAIKTLGRIDDPAEASYVARRTAELERQKREHADAPEVDWSRGKGEGN